MNAMKPALAVVTGMLLLASSCGGCECPAYSIAVFFKSGDPFVDGLHGLQVTIDGQTTLCQVDSTVQPETVDCDGAGFKVNFSRESVALILLDDEPGVQISVVVSEQGTTWEGSVEIELRDVPGDDCRCDYGLGETYLEQVE